jgi:hypothetical protein
VNTLHKGDDDYYDDNNNTIEVQHMWSVITKVIQVTMGGTEIVSKSFRKYLSNLPENQP